MPIQSVGIKVSGVPLIVNFDTGLQAYIATIPAQSAVYTVEIDSADMASTTIALITFLSNAQGEIVKFFIQTNASTPVSEVEITAFYRNSMDGTDHGRAEVQRTDVAGAAYLHLNQGSYNIYVKKTGFATKIIKNFQVLTGIVVFDGPGPTPHQHTVRDQIGVVIENASVKVEDMTLDPESRLIAHKKTDPNGMWDTALPNGRLLAITFEKEAFDFQKVVVQND